MIDNLYIDGLRVMADGGSYGNYHVNKFMGLQLPSPRVNRPPRSRRHGAIELTTYYDPREFQMDIWVLGSVTPGGGLTTDKYSWISFWNAFDALKDKISLSDLQRTIRFTRAGNPYGDDETADVVFDECEPVWPHPGTPVCVFRGLSAVAKDPRLYSLTLHTASLGGSITNAGNFPSPPSITVSGGATITNNSLATENRIIVSGGCTIDCRARTINGGADPQLLDAGESFFWSLRKGVNNISSTAGGTISWYDARV